MKYKISHKVLESCFGNSSYFNKFYYHSSFKESMSRAQIDKDLNEIKIAWERILLDFYKPLMN